jgi:hypothetical protein
MECVLERYETNGKKQSQLATICYGPVFHLGITGNEWIYMLTKCITHLVAIGEGSSAVHVASPVCIRRLLLNVQG